MIGLTETLLSAYRLIARQGAALDRVEALAQEWEGMKDTKYRYVAACIRGAMRGDDMAEQAEQVNLRD